MIIKEQIWVLSIGALPILMAVKSQPFTILLFHYLCDHKTLENQLHKSRNREQLVILAMEQDVLYMITETRNYTQSYTPVGKSSGTVCRMLAIC